jgi:hypothetical protein
VSVGAAVMAGGSTTRSAALALVTEPPLPLTTTE